MFEKVLILFNDSSIMEKQFLSLFILLVYLLIYGEEIFSLHGSLCKDSIGKLIATAQTP